MLRRENDRAPVGGRHSRMISIYAYGMHGRFRLGYGAQFVHVAAAMAGADPEARASRETLCRGRAAPSSKPLILPPAAVGEAVRSGPPRAAVGMLVALADVVAVVVVRDADVAGGQFHAILGNCNSGRSR